MSTTTPEGEPTEPTRWHPCSICSNPEGAFHQWWVVACADCLPALLCAINKTYEEFRAHHKNDERP